MPHGDRRPAVFLDRDDTINVNAGLPPEAFPGTPGDLYLPGHVALLPGVVEACRAIRTAGYAIIVITNQGGVARGHATMRDIDATNDRIRELLPEPANEPSTAPFGGTLIDAFYTGPHHPSAVAEHLGGNHPWRKPGPGMILAAAEDHGIDIARSWMIGDKRRDAEAAIAAGVPAEQCFVIGTAQGCDFVDLREAAGFIVSLDVQPEPPAPPRLRAATTVTLRAPGGRPLAGRGIRDTVESTARAIAERTGINLLSIACSDSAVTATLETHRLAATAFMAELRRLTNRWHAGRFDGASLWPAAKPGDDA